MSTSPFDAAVALALAEISSVDATREAYRRDLAIWVRFCGDFEVDLTAPQDGAVVAWREWMKKQGHAPKSRGRRMSSLSSIYRELRRRKVVEHNPFSVDDGPKREPTDVQEPTPIASPEVVRKVLAACAADTTPLGLRDAAMVRVLWSTGMRRVSLLSMTMERLQRDPDGYIATVLKKGGKTQRALVRGQARLALDRWLEVLKGGQFRSGKIWRAKNGEPMTARDVNRAIAARAAACGERLSPHMLRVAFVTFNPAGAEAKQDAAGHADINTTRLYDRASWRGREAFESMPEVEDIE